MRPFISDIVIRYFQKKYVKAFGGTLNALQPGAESRERPFDGGILLNDIRYESPYPNSFIDIFYGNSRETKKPTLIYLHGGGFFMGGRNIGDPLTGLATRGIAKQNIFLAQKGFNVVSMDYCLSPAYRYPRQILQVQDGLKWLRENADSLHLDMENVILFGSSAGAVLTAILGCALSNPAYADSIGLRTTFPLKALKGVCIDGAPLNHRLFDWKVRTMFRCWVGGTDLSGEKAAKIHVGEFVTKDFPRTFLTAGNDGCFMEHTQELGKALRALGVEVTEFYPNINVSHEGHGYLGNWETSGEANRGMEAMIAFMNRASMK